MIQEKSPAIRAWCDEPLWYFFYFMRFIICQLWIMTIRNIILFRKNEDGYGIHSFFACTLFSEMHDLNWCWKSQILLHPNLKAKLLKKDGLIFFSHRKGHSVSDFFKWKQASGLIWIEQYIKIGRTLCIIFHRAFHLSFSSIVLLVFLI